MNAVMINFTCIQKVSDNPDLICDNERAFRKVAEKPINNIYRELLSSEDKIRILTIGGTWTRVLRFLTSFDPEIFGSQIFRYPLRVRWVVK